MEAVIGLFDIKYVIVSAWGFNLSLIELLAIASGLLSVHWASTMNLRTWTSGLVNEALFFGVFYQVQLYSDMLLQLFFAVVTMYGWLSWSSIPEGQRAPRLLAPSHRALSLLALIGITAGLGATMSSAHEVLPALFPKPAAAPYTDGFTAAGSVVATILMARRAIESWIFWIVVNIVSIALYLSRDIPSMSLLYCVFLMLAIRGFASWRKQLRYG